MKNNIEDRLPVVEIIAPNGAKIRFYEQTSAEVVKELIDAFIVEKKLVLAGVDEIIRN